MDIKTLLRESSKQEREAFAQRCGTSVGYLYLLAGGHRNPSHGLCKRMIRADDRLTLEGLRPDIFGEPPKDEAA